jgi:hypothetical protein
MPGVHIQLWTLRAVITTSALAGAPKAPESLLNSV